MNYKAITQNEFQLNDYKLIPIEKEHMESIRQWRNQQMNVLRQKQEISVEAQQMYFQTVVQPLFNESKPKQMLFSYLLNDELIGYGALVNISWEDYRAELSFLVKPDRATNQELYDKDFSTYIQLLKTIVFDVMNFNRLFTETYEFRKFHISIMEKNGFVEEGTMYQNIFESGKFYNSILHHILRSQYEKSKE